MVQAMDAEFGLNFNMMKKYIVGVISPDGLPNLLDHKVSCWQYMLRITQANKMEPRSH